MLRLAIRQIKQIDNYHFQIEWNDEKLNIYNLNTIQKNCPCAGCAEKKSDSKLAATEFSSPQVRAVTLKSVGRYALKIHFTSGCSAGIYDYTLLRNLAKK